MGMCCIKSAACPPWKANKFRQEKIKLLEDFSITLTEREMEVFETLVIAREIEEFVCDIFRNRLG